ncbi:MAG: toll/interleukin-1 receptor domain-containing protein [Roseomonas sp.]|nr:toll/interleukin-1 receptor domain-containing protein [Roseomonas sp.]
MKVFFSWSGKQGQQIAGVLREWLPGVLQAVKPYFSPEDLKAGSRWSPEIASQLEACSMGVIIVTAESKHAPWLMFEAGAISKKVSEASVCPILFGLKIADLDGPLSQFQSVNFSKDDIERVVSTMNDKLADARLDPSVLKTVFEKFWPDLETKIEAVITAKRETRGLPKGREDRELLEEMLSLLRDLSRGPGIRSLRRADSDYDDLGHSSTIIGLMLESLNLIETMMRSRYFREQWGSVDLMLSFMKRLLSDPRIRGRLGSKQSEEVIAKIGFIERYVEREEVIYRNSLANALINSPKEELGQRNE